MGILGDMAVERQHNLKKEALERTRKEYLNQIIVMSERESDESEIEVFEDKAFLCDIYNICKEQIRNLIFLFIAGIPIIILEKWSVLKGLYWVVITATTIGLGDEHPDNPWSRLLCIIYIPLAVAFCGKLVGMIATSYVDRRNDALEAQFFSRAVTQSDLSEMDFNADGHVTRDEFLVYMLLTLQKVDKSDIEEILDLFTKLDKDGSGTLTMDDIAFISNKTSCLHMESLRSLRRRPTLSIRQSFVS